MHTTGGLVEVRSASQDHTTSAFITPVTSNKDDVMRLLIPTLRLPKKYISFTSTETHQCLDFLV